MKQNSLLEIFEFDLRHHFFFRSKNARFQTKSEFCSKSILLLFYFLYFPFFWAFSRPTPDTLAQDHKRNVCNSPIVQRADYCQQATRISGKTVRSDISIARRAAGRNSAGDPNHFQTTCEWNWPCSVCFRCREAQAPVDRLFHRIEKLVKQANSRLSFLKMITPKPITKQSGSQSF